MADEYIKKKDIEQKVTAITGEWKDGPEFWIPIEAVLGNIDLLPAEDVAPVRHGRWEAIECGVNHSGEIVIGRVYQCSECRRIIDLERDETPNDYPYCHCGAKMDYDEWLASKDR